MPNAGKSKGYGIVEFETEAEVRWDRQLCTSHMTHMNSHMTHMSHLLLCLCICLLYPTVLALLFRHAGRQCHL